MTRLTATVALSTLLVAASPAQAARQGDQRKVQTSLRTGTTMAEALKICTIKSARLNLIGEQVLTRTTVTVERADTMSPPVVIPEGDPRLARLKLVLEGLRFEPSKQPSIDIRTLIRLQCTDGTTRTIAAARTYDGRIDLSVDGRMASTFSPLRRDIEALAVAS